MRDKDKDNLPADPAHDDDSLPMGRALRCDFVGGAVQHRLRFGGGRGQDLPKAAGFKPGINPHIIDATAGLGRDAFLLASLGATVTMIERSADMHALLLDGMARALDAGGVTAEIISRMTLIHGDAIQLLPDYRRKSYLLTQCTRRAINRLWSRRRCAKFGRSLALMMTRPA